MPGNIRVAVLEAVDLPNTVTDGKSVAVKVSVGRREYQTTAVEPQDGRTEPWNLEYLFPVLNLRDNLLVSLMDNKGDVVARAELETPQIVQKGFQDAFIALKAGGRIHIKVSFVLTDEERRKIETMRLAALKKRKGLNNQSFRSRRAPLSNVKITEISPEEAENLETAPPKVDSIDSTPDSGDIDRLPARKAPKLDESAREQSESSPKPRPTSSPKPNLSPRSCDSPVPAADTAVSTNATCPNPNPTVSEGPSCKSDGSRHKIFNWLSRRQNDLVEGDGKFLDLTLKTTVDKSTSVKAAKADEWIKNLDRGSDKPGICKREGSKPKKHSQEQRIYAKDSHKTVKQKLEDWREKELGPWRRTSKVRHASPPGSDGGTSWLLRAGCKPKQSELQSAADTTLIESASPSPSSSPESHKKSSGGVKHLVKQVLTGAAVVAGALVLWPRKSSSKHKGRIHTVQQGETLSSIAPGEWEDPDSNFYRLNPHIRHKDAIYPGQRIRLS